jgi:hypothetical protein
MEATASPLREVHHAPEPGGDEPINPKWLTDFRFDAHSGLTSREVRKGAKTGLATSPRAALAPREVPPAKLTNDY